MIKQRTNNDCLQCCLSELLNIPYEEIPEFYKLYVDENEVYVDSWEHNFELKYNEWLKAKGLTRLVFEASFDGEALKTPYVSDQYRGIGILKKPDRNYSHAVILNFLDDNTITGEDPKEDSDYTIEDLIRVEILVSGICGKESL